MRSFNNVPHLVCRTTAARAVAKINNGCSEVTVKVREEDHQKLKRDIVNFSVGVFSRQVTSRITQLLSAAEGVRLESVVTTVTPSGLRLVCEVSR